MKTLVEWNGSKWAGQAPDSIEKLFEVLEQEPLCPDRVRTLGFATQVQGSNYTFGVVPDQYQGFTWHFTGNFHALSHGFSIYTCDEALIERLIAAGKKNMASEAYLAAKREYEGK